MVMEFNEEEFEDLLVGNISNLGLIVNNKNLYVDVMEGNSLDPNNPEDSVYIRQTPACIVGIRGLPTATPLDGSATEYMMDFDLRIWISAYDTKRKAQAPSGIRTLRKKIRKEIYGKNIYKFGNSHIKLVLQSDDVVGIVNDVIIYEQTYTGKFIEVI